MTRRAIVSQLAVSGFAILGGVVAEALAGHGNLLGAVPVLGLWAWPAALAAVVLAWLLAALCGEESAFWTARDAVAEPATRDAVLVGWGALTLHAACVFVGVKASFAFHNVELAAALVALLLTVALLLLVALGYTLWRALAARRERGGDARWLFVAVAALSCAVTGWLLHASWSGLAQLDGRLLLAPCVTALLLVFADIWQPVRSRARVVASAVAVVAVAAWCMFLAAGNTSLATRGVWTGPLIGALQQLSDFDRDGYSSFLGGGDCAPFDAAVGPGAAEVAGDGIDNNCVGGDAGKALVPRKPIWGASVHGSPTNQNVVIVTIETLRHDHASFIAAEHDTTPTLRGLAQSSLVFERMYSAAPYTRLALASLFSSYAPSEVDWQLQAPEKHMRHIGAGTPWLPELLSARGYETIAVLTDFSAFSGQENIGFERGFRRYDISTKLEYRGGTMWGFPAAEQVDKALGYVKEAKQPFLLWLHFFEPHFRYEQPPGAPVFGGDERARYDAEIWHVDQQLGRLLAGLREQGVWDDTVLFVSGDHGEAFGEHDDRWHGTNLFEPQIRPAALLRVPGVAGKRLDVSVTFTDVAPTIARVLGDRQTFDQLRGRSLAPLMHHRTLPEQDGSFVSETFNIEDGRAYQAALVAYPLKLIYSEEGHRFSLYDLVADPREMRALDVAADPRGAPLLRDLVGYLERARPRVLRQR